MFGESCSYEEMGWAHGNSTLNKDWAKETVSKLRQGKITLIDAASNVVLDTILGKTTVYMSEKTLSKLLKKEDYLEFKPGLKDFTHFDDNLPVKVCNYQSRTMVGIKKTWCYLNKENYKCSRKYVTKIYDGFIRQKIEHQEKREKPRCRYVCDKVNGIWHGDFHQLDVEFKQKYLFALIDDASRYITGYIVADNKESDTLLLAFQNAIKENGKPLVYWSDNGGENVSEKVRHFLEENDILPITAEPYNPQQNGKIERFWDPLDKFIRGKKFKNTK